MTINPGSHDPQGPWDPDEKKRYFDLRYFWVLMPYLILVVVTVAAAYALG